MLCTNCGTENQPTRRFCRECGAPLVLPCPACGAENDPTDKYCGRCGVALGPPADANGEPGGDERSRESPPPPLGRDPFERRFVSVLFADLVGFTQFSEGRDPETVRAMLTTYYERAREIVTRFGGIVEKFIGDAVMAVWGATVTHEDDAERAVRAGLELVQAIHRLRSELGNGDLAVRVGVLSGEASVAPATPERGFVVGDLVNTAARLQSIAEPGTVVVGESTRGMLQGVVRFEPLGEHSLKGKSNAVPVWRALGPIDRTQPAPLGVLQPAFVGRAEELRLLTDALHATERVGRVRLVSVIGEAGIGKSRLAWELRKHVEGLTDDVYWHEGRSPAFDQGLPLWALGEMVRQRAGIAETEDTSASAAKLSGAVGEFVPVPSERQWIERRLAALLGLNAEPTGERTEFFTAIRRFFEAIGSRKTTVLVFEDFHWADAGLIEFVNELVAHSANVPILVVTLARPDLLDRTPGWGAGRRNFASVHLGPLTDDEMTSLVTGMVEGVGDDVVAAIVARANGIPLFAVELVRMLIADGDLEFDDDACCRPTGDLTSIRVPDTVRAVVGARLDRLPVDTRAVLQDAAVMGNAFTRAGLAAMSRTDEERIDGQLDELVHRELLEFENDPRSAERGQFRFVQSMIREVAYDRLTPDERRTRHVRAAEYYSGQGDIELVGAVAGHFTAAHRETSDPERATELAAEARVALSGAADRAALLHSHNQSLEMLEQALEFSVDPAETARLWQQAARSASALAHHERAVSYARRALEWHRAHSGRDDVASAAALVGDVMCHGYRPDDAVRVLEPIVAADPSLAAQGAIEAGAQLARAYLMTLHDEEAATTADSVLREAERMALLPTVVNTLITRGTALGNLGRLREAVSLLEGAARDAREHSLPLAELRATNNLAHLLAFDDHVAALDVSRHGLEQANRVADVRFIGSFAWVLSAYLDRDARCEEAQALRDETRRRVELPPGSLAWFRVSDLHARVVAGDRSAIAAARDAIERATADADPQSRAWLPATRARLDLLAGDAAAAYAALMVGDDAHRFPDHLVVATVAAGLLRDVDRLRAVAVAVDASPARGRELGSLRNVIDGSIAALEGRPSDAAAAWSRALEFRYLRLDRAQLQALFASLVASDTPEARAASEEARAVFTGCGAVGYLELYSAGLPSASARHLAAGGGS